ncbi:hypothetical protein O181_048034, partial [Austropuccinia psidii MF-1]|nr:hypothetical protein [Austropuccinia psidii MF-1]
SLVLQQQGQKDKELVGELKYYIHRPKEGVGNDPSFGERRTISINKLQNNPKTTPKHLRRNREVPGTIKARETQTPMGTDLTHTGKGLLNWNLPLCTVCSIWPEPLWSSHPRNRKG